MVSAETRAKVLEAAESLGYRPNSAAITLGKKKAGVIALWMTLRYSRLRGQLLDTARSLLTTADTSLTVWDIEDSEANSVERAFRTWVDGIIAFDSPQAVTAIERRFNRSGPNVPFVALGEGGSPVLSYVTVDVRAGMCLAIRHLKQTGRRRIAFMTLPGESRTRLNAFREAMPDGQTLFVRSRRSADIDEAISEIATLPDAMICLDDDLALSVASSLMRRGIALGGDVALVGFDGVRETGEGACPITTVAQPISEMCELALEFLREQIRRPMEPPRQIVLTPQLIVRESSLPGCRPDHQP